MAVSLSALSAGRPSLPRIFLVLISVRGWVDSRAIVRLEGLGQSKNPITSSGLEPATFRLADKIIAINWFSTGESVLCMLCWTLSTVWGTHHSISVTGFTSRARLLTCIRMVLSWNIISWYFSLSPWGKYRDITWNFATIVSFRILSSSFISYLPTIRTGTAQSVWRLRYDLECAFVLIWLRTRGRDFWPLRKVQACPGTHTITYIIGTRGGYIADHSPQSSAEFRNGGTVTPLCHSSS
jgi:hypothetical protein